MLGLNLKESRVYQEAIAEGELNLVLRQLTRRLQQNLSNELRSQISTLPLPRLEELGEALLDFTTLTDLEQWLASHPLEESTSPSSSPPPLND